ncbi:GntR family transcriptional regulator [Crenobacter cavernae]|uniref:GntR family transcriptional regulator n=1 Tax=Crenobacter cavernae TaxID=2290923 RepID=A0ABY0FGL6_9NEIS|nr:GntR family transcriptional regulator [Crenobacter cavernae]RXZ45533.1 GntR family transcriptional regulator [Crenobacter cavernae]
MTSNKLRRQPLYEQIKQLLLRRIAEGEWQENASLPSEWELAEELSVSQGTVRKALTELVAEGVLYRQQGRGTFVAEAASDWGEARLQTIGTLSGRQESLMQELLGCWKSNAPEEVSELMGLRRLVPMIRVRQLWRLGGQPVALDDAYLPADRFEGLEARWLRQAGGVYAALQRRFGVRPKTVMEQMRISALNREDAQLLMVAADTPVLAVTRLSTSIEGDPVEWRMRYCLTQQVAYTQLRG